MQNYQQKKLTEYYYFRSDISVGWLSQPLTTTGEALPPRVLTSGVVVVPNLNALDGKLKDLFDTITSDADDADNYGNWDIHELADQLYFRFEEGDSYEELCEWLEGIIAEHTNS